MNALQKSGLIGSLLCLVAAMLGIWLREGEYAVGGLLAAGGFVLMLVFLLIFAVGRMTAKQ